MLAGNNAHGADQTKAKFRGAKRNAYVAKTITIEVATPVSLVSIASLPQQVVDKTSKTRAAFENSFLAGVVKAVDATYKLTLTPSPVVVTSITKASRRRLLADVSCKIAYTVTMPSAAIAAGVNAQKAAVQAAGAGVATGSGAAVMAVAATEKPVDCAGAFGACTKTCGGGTQVFKVTAAAKFAGKACTAKDGASLACAAKACPPTVAAAASGASAAAVSLAALVVAVAAMLN